MSTPPWALPHEEHLHHVGPPRVRFSPTEVLHLGVSVVALSYALAILLDPSTQLQERLLPAPGALLAAAVAVSSGFVLHELAHKVVAQRYGHWAEFRAHFPGLGLSVLVAAMTGLLFAAPGAVFIQGRVTPRENGLISLVGPGVNFLVSLLCLPFFAFRVDTEGFTPTLLATVAGVNALLAVFNLLPFGPFDGRKVWRWSRVAYIVAVVLSLALFVLCVMQGAFPR